MKQGEKIRILCIIALVGVITVSHYISELKQHQHHIFYQAVPFVDETLER